MSEKNETWRDLCVQRDYHQFRIRSDGGECAKHPFFLPTQVTRWLVVRSYEL